MKWILLLLLSFNLQAQETSATPSEPIPPVISCGYGSHERIDACTVEDEFPSLMTEGELAAWKVTAKADLDFKLSVTGMDRVRRRMIKCGYSESNTSKLKLKIVEDKDTPKRDCLNSHTSALDLEDAQADIREDIINDMAFAKSISIDFISFVRSGGKNLAKNKRLLNKLNTTQSLLNVGDIEGARDELASLTTDADLSQQAKDMVLSKLNSYLGQ